jgi:uncharacterized protein YkwD
LVPPAGALIAEPEPAGSYRVGSSGDLSMARHRIHARSARWLHRLLPITVALTLALLMVLVPESATPSQAASNAVNIVNAYRALAGLGTVTEDTTLSAGAVNHSRYMVKNQVGVHAETPGNPYYTTSGNQAGTNGNTFIMWPASSFTDQMAIDFWMAGAFHQMHLVDPMLRTIGYGSYLEATATANDIEAGATMDVLSAAKGPAGTKPIMFPGNGKTTTLRTFGGNEFPDPFTTASCAGYTASFDNPSGPAITLQIASVPSVTAHSITRNGTAVEHCWLDETTYTNPDGPTQALGRQVLANALDGSATRHAIALLPRQPLADGTYNVSITSNGTVYAWTFFVGTPPAQRTLTVSKAGTGSGTVTGTGITCGADCTETYNDGTGVTLTATASAGSTFAGWSGACTNATGTCSVTMNAAKSVTATFNAVAAQSFTATATTTQSTVPPGGSVGITATVITPPAGTYVVDIEIYDASHDQVFQWYWENEPFTAGQTRQFSTTWQVPANLTPGSYSVEIGIFSGPEWATEHLYNDHAATITVGGCSPRPPVRLTLSRGSGGQLIATASAGLGSLREIRFGAATNARITVPAGSGGRAGMTSSPGNASLILTDRPVALTFSVARATAGQATTVPLVLVDDCGEWRTFVGGGKSAF